MTSEFEAPVYVVAPTPVYAQWFNPELCVDPTGSHGYVGQRPQVDPIGRGHQQEATTSKRGHDEVSQAYWEDCATDMICKKGNY